MYTCAVFANMPENLLKMFLQYFYKNFRNKMRLLEKVKMVSLILQQLKKYSITIHLKHFYRPSLIKARILWIRLIKSDLENGL